MMKKYLLVWLIILLSFNCGKNKNKIDEKVIVTVGKGSLTLEQLNSEIPVSVQSKVSKEQLNKFLQQWIEIELIYQDALRLGMDKERDFETELEKSKRESLVRKYFEKYLSGDAQISDEEMQVYYEENKDNFVLAQDEIKALHILVPSYNEAIAARSRITRGEDFETVAREVVHDSTERDRIRLDYFTAEDVIPEIARNLFNNWTRSGNLTEPIKSDFGYHILKILDIRRKGNLRAFDEVKDQIAARLNLIKRNEIYRDRIIELRNATNINSNLDLLNTIYSDSDSSRATEVIDNLK
jgi:parvulin-like peptidyl-prolyl isomerase